MARIRYARSVEAAIEDCDLVLLVLPREALSKLSRTGLPAKMVKPARQLGRRLKPGDLGRSAQTLVAGTPQRLVLGLLPDDVSRHNCPARAESIRRVCAEAGLLEARSAAVVLVLDRAEHLLAAANAVGRSYALYSRKKYAKKASRLALAAVLRDGTELAVDRRVRATVDATRRAAAWVDTPPSEFDPAAFQEQAWAFLDGLSGVRRRALIGPALLKAGLGGIHAVGRTASSPPRMLVARRTASGTSKRKRLHVALVGKGITYDTGGLSLKRNNSMCGMKADMGGAAATLGAFGVLAKNGCPLDLSLVLCLAENAIGPASYKPDDVLTMHSGLSVEINNTDAEGRLLLADGVSWASRKLKADVVLDAATLTGAQGIATGKLHAAVVASDEDLESVLVQAGRASGDLVHALPFAPEFYRSEFKSPIADMRNSVANRANAQVSCAAQFVHEHMSETGARWGHIDLASPAFRADRGTGFGVALLSETVRTMAALPKPARRGR